MNVKRYARRNLAAATLVASIAGAIGAAGIARADSLAPSEPAPTTQAPAGAVAEEAPPDSTADASPPTSAVSDSAVAFTTSTTAPPTTTTTPPAAIATTTTTAPAATTATTPQSVIAQPVAAIAPTAPLSPVATPANASVKLSWSPPSSNGGATIDRYRVQRAPSAGGPWTTLSEPPALSYTAIGLTNGTSYSFRIAAHNASGWGAYSTVVSAKPRTVPTAPQSPVATPANASVKVSWLAPSSNGGAAIDKYAVQRATSAAGPWTNVAATSPYTASALTNGVRYYFRIVAHNAAGWSPVSTVVSAVPRTVPSAPTYLDRTPGDGWVALTWKPPTSTGGAAIDMYMVMRAESLAGPWTTLPVQTPTNGIYGGLVNGKTYYFRVSAHNAAGWGPNSTVIGVPRTVPGAVPSCSASQQNAGWFWLQVNWQVPSNGGAPIDHYKVELWKNGQFYISYIKEAYQTSGGATVYSAGWYEVRVSAHNAAGYGPYCSVTAPVFQ